MPEINSIYETEITGYGSDGAGVGRIDGIAVFVPYSAVGDTVKVRIVSAHKSYMRGEITEILKPSADRSNAFCPSYTECGGCNISHLSYEAQLKYKRQKVADALRKIGGFNITVSDTIASDQIIGYRNKVRVHICRENGDVFAGFYKSKTHSSVKSAYCALQSAENLIIINEIISYITEKDAPVSSIYLRIIDQSIMVSLEARSLHLPAEKELTARIKTACDSVSSIIISAQSKLRTLYGTAYQTDSLLGLKFNIHHDSFYQINKNICEKIYTHALGLLGDMKDKTVFDIYCGIGTISLFLAKKAKRVVGIEYLPRSVKDARENARINNINNTEFYAGDAAKVLHEMASGGENADYIVLDPPRKGCDVSLLNTIGTMKPEKIVYISCNCATLARDIKIISEYGYSTRSVTPFDMFPQTSHVETAVLMSHVKQ